ncbi:hypothetical protein M569_06649, partial [Genlisea aurea]
EIDSGSVLVALLDSRYTAFSEMVEKGLLLQELERAVSERNVTVFAPRNEALEEDLDPEFKRFLSEPRNVGSLRNLLLFHVISGRIEGRSWPGEASDGVCYHASLADDEEEIPLRRGKNGERIVSTARVFRPDDVVRPDGIVHGIERLLIPKSVRHEFDARRSLISASSVVIPDGAPEFDLQLKAPAAPPVSVLPVSDALAPGSDIAPAPAPGPGGPNRHIDGESQVKDFIETLLRYGGYSETADVLVNLTSLASEMGRLISDGYVLTVLAPNDEAMSKLTAELLSEPGAPEQIMYHHLMPEYQTEESMYNSVRRFGKVRYGTLSPPHKLVAEEADGSVRFGEGEASAYLFDPDIYTDGRISVQGIDGVLF